MKVQESGSRKLEPSRESADFSTLPNLCLSISQVRLDAADFLRSELTIPPVSRSRSKLFKSRYTSQCDHTTLRTGEGNFVVFHKKSQLPITDAPSEDDPENAVLESFSATVDYLPNGAFPKSKISVSFEQFISFRSATSLNPVLSFCAMISDDAEIFQLIYEDDVHGVQRMIEQGRASLRDCDSVGRSLLYVRCVSAKTDV